MTRKKGGVHLDPSPEEDVEKHKFLDFGVMRSGILEVCQGMRLGGELSQRQITPEGFLASKRRGLTHQPMSKIGYVSASVA